MVNLKNEIFLLQCVRSLLINYISQSVQRKENEHYYLFNSIVFKGVIEKCRRLKNHIRTATIKALPDIVLSVVLIHELLDSVSGRL